MARPSSLASRLAPTVRARSCIRGRAARPTRWQALHTKASIALERSGGAAKSPALSTPSQSFSSIASSCRIASESSIAPDIRAAANSMTTFSLNKSGRAAE